MEDEKRSRILVVDFDNELLVQEQILLEEFGFDVTTTWSVREASELLLLQKFELLLLGDYLPDTGAREIRLMLRNVPSSTEVAVIQSAHPTIPDINELREYARYCALPRGTPVQIADLVVQCLRQAKKGSESNLIESSRA
ncbi:MAG TPA: hypothetical protein VJW77_17120 [Terriglobia bacterium]|nr:hypothetical protein [Terriglobia bacterium]